MPELLIQVRQLEPDYWGYARLQNVKTGRIYADISFDKGDWHTTTSEGEALYRLRRDIVFEIVDLKPFQCCPDAKSISCVCAYSYDCPTHGTKHIGTHE